MPDGALKPEFEVGAVNATFLPLKSAGVLDRAVGRHDDFHLVAEGAALVPMMANGT